MLAIFKKRMRNFPFRLISKAIIVNECFRTLAKKLMIASERARIDGWGKGLEKGTR